MTVRPLFVPGPATPHGCVCLNGLCRGFASGAAHFIVMASDVFSVLDVGHALNLPQPLQRLLAELCIAGLD